MEQANKASEDTHAILEKYKNIFISTNFGSDLQDKMKNHKPLNESDIAAMQNVLEMNLADVASTCQHVLSLYFEENETELKGVQVM